MIPNLTQAQGFAFVGEITSTRNLLGYGLRVLKEGRFFDTTKDPIFTMLSIGVEKHLKLVLGVISLDSAQCWPTRSEMKGYGHGIAEMWDRVMGEVKARTASKGDYLRGLVAAVDADPVLRPLLEVLDRYGQSGRFYNLDLLAEDPQRELAPDELFRAVEHTAMAEPEVLRTYTAAMSNVSDQAAWDEFYATLRGRIARSIEQAWEMLSRVGMHGAFGPVGNLLGVDLRAESVGRQ